MEDEAEERLKVAIPAMVVNGCVEFGVTEWTVWRKIENDSVLWNCRKCFLSLSEIYREGQESRLDKESFMDRACS